MATGDWLIFPRTFQDDLWLAARVEAGRGQRTSLPRLIINARTFGTGFSSEASYRYR